MEWMEGGKSAPELGFKLSPAICSNRRWNTEPGNPGLNKCLSNCISSEISDWGGLGPTCEMIHTCEEIHLARGWWEGPTRSMCTWSKRASRVANVARGEVMWWYTFDF